MSARRRLSVLIAGVVVTLGVGTTPVAIAAPLIPPGLNLGSSGGAPGSGQGVGEVSLSRTIQWHLRAGDTPVGYGVSVSPEDQPYRQCVNDRTGTFTFNVTVNPHEEFTRSDNLGMLASQALFTCDSKESTQAWTIEIYASRFPQTQPIKSVTRSNLVKYRYQNNNFRVAALGADDIGFEKVGSNLVIDPPVPDFG